MSQDIRKQRKDSRKGLRKEPRNGLRDKQICKKRSSRMQMRFFG
jgi:hypothetical protein